MSSGGPLSSKGVQTGAGGSVATKAVPIGGTSSPAVPLPVVTPGEIAIAPVASRTGVVIMVPTAINSVLMVAENVVDNLRAGQSASLVLPSLYKRAFLVAYETDEIAVAKRQA